LNLKIRPKFHVIWLKKLLKVRRFIFIQIIGLKRNMQGYAHD
jgi:hypothetical protein